MVLYPVADREPHALDRAAEKQAQRDIDQAAVSSGAKTVDQLRAENSLTVGVTFKPLDYSRMPRARI